MLVGALAVVVCVCLSVLAGCSSSPEMLDEAATERAVGRAVAAEVGPVVRSTQCAAPIEQEQGATFTCKVALKGAGPLAVTVRQVDGEGTLDVEPTAAVVAGKRVASELGASLEEQFERSFQVTCDGAAWQIRQPGSTSTCLARDKTSRRTVTVTVTDVAGTLSFAVGPEAD